MLEPIDAFIECKEFNYNNYKLLKPFLLFYISEQGCKFFDEYKLMNMLRYFKIYKGTNVDDIGNYGKYFRDNHQKFIEFEKNRQNRYGNSYTKRKCYIENPVYLISIYNKLKQTLRNDSQYIILKEAILLLSPVDTQYFINILLKKYSTQQIQQIINKIENGKTK